MGEISGTDGDFFLTYYTLVMWKRILEIGLIALQSRIKTQGQTPHWFVASLPHIRRDDGIANEPCGVWV